MSKVKSKKQLQMQEELKLWKRAERYYIKELNEAHGQVVFWTGEIESLEEDEENDGV